MRILERRTDMGLREPAAKSAFVAKEDTQEFGQLVSKGETLMLTPKQAQYALAAGTIEPAPAEGAKAEAAPGGDVEEKADKVGIVDPQAQAGQTENPGADFPARRPAIKTGKA